MERFQLIEQNNQVLAEKHNIGKVFLWLIEHEYFNNNPESQLTVKELFTNGFEYQINKDTKSQDVESAWNCFNRF